MKKMILFLFFIHTTTSCLHNKTVTPKESTKEYNGNLYFATYDDERYPIDTVRIGPDDSLSLFVNKWYSKHFNSLQEQPIYNRKDENINIVRFTNLGTWSRPFMYKIEQKNGKLYKVYKQTNGLGGYQTGRITKNIERQIDNKKWDEIISKANEIDFWNIKTHDPYFILDGEEWILELLVNGKYHLVYRNSPENYGSEQFAELCKLISE